MIDEAERIGSAAHQALPGIGFEVAVHVVFSARFRVVIHGVPVACPDQVSGLLTSLLSAQPTRIGRTRLKKASRERIGLGVGIAGNLRASGEFSASLGRKTTCEDLKSHVATKNETSRRYTFVSPALGICFMNVILGWDGLDVVTYWDKFKGLKSTD